MISLLHAVSALGVRSSRASLVLVDRPSAVDDSFDGLAELGELCVQAARHGGIVVVDESYANYRSPDYSAATIADRLDNLAVFRGLSKGYWLGGLRLAYCVCSSALTERMIALVPPMLAAAGLPPPIRTGSGLPHLHFMTPPRHGPHPNEQRGRLNMTTKTETGQAVLAAKTRLGLTWAAIAEALDRPLAWTTAALLGQHPVPEDIATKAGELLELTAEQIGALRLQPTRGALDAAVPVDPTIYRFYEVLQVYGPTIKELIHEQFGDGIMSAINFRLDVSRVPDPAGDRVVVTLDGKFLPYQW